MVRELEKGDMIGIRIIGADGEMLAEADGKVTGVAFIDHEDQYGEVVSTERKHTVRVRH